jgi:hypothetical protein
MQLTWLSLLDSPETNSKTMRHRHKSADRNVSITILRIFFNELPRRFFQNPHSEVLILGCNLL